jgi:hypothetical protein
MFRNWSQRYKHSISGWLGQSVLNQCALQLPPGVNVIITIFCDFRQFSAKKIGVFLKQSAAQNGPPFAARGQCYESSFRLKKTQKHGAFVYAMKSST